MGRKTTAYLFVLGLMITVIVSVCSTKASNVSVDLKFNGSTATCMGTVVGNGSISATLELWQGSTKLVSWPGSGSGYVQISQPYTVVSGVTYTLRLNGTINGVSFPEISETKTCP